MRHRAVADVSDLPTYAFGPRSPIWWGTLGFIAIEAMGFALSIGAYLYLVAVNPHWPLASAPPNHWPGTLITVILLLSLLPNWLSDKHAEAHDLWKVRADLLVMVAVGALAIGIRFWEFTQLEVRWDQNAYGSITWLILGLHATHLITDWGDTVVLTVLMFTRHGRGKRFSDVSDNAFYWYFVVAAWLPLYAIIYWLPRLGK